MRKNLLTQHAHQKSHGISLKMCVGALIVSLVFAGCAILKYNTAYQKYNFASLVDTLPISKGGVSITMSNLDLNEYFKPEYSVQYPVLWNRNGESIQKTSTRYSIINLFYQMAAYNVEVVNNTNNVLSLADSRIALIIPDASEPVFALSKPEMKKLIETSQLPCILFETSQARREFPNLDIPLAKKALQEIVFGIVKGKSIVSRTTEVLPGMKVKGYLVFPYDSEKIANGTVSFIDIKSSTDEAGNTTLKTRFDYKVREEQVFIKREYSQEQRKYLPFARISEEEYNAAQQPKNN
ncbi:MAG: hypothetical protein LBT94_01995 [Prevotellaceae bacterium]|jgi:hypothetical protein|nr:hypothetical protein [Prevotellaceae bacterium]